MKGHEARKRILGGVIKICDIVETTYGPYGHNVILAQGLRPKITKDGATVAAEVDSDDPWEKMGIQLTKDVVSRVDTMSGDGTTTTTIYFRHLMEGAEKLASRDFNCRNVRKGIVRASDAAVDFLEKNKLKVKDIRAVVDISSNGSKEIADLLTEAIESVGEDGAIHLDESTRKDGKSFVRKSTGYTWNGGYPSSVFISDQTSKSSVVKNPWILISEQPLLEDEDWDSLELLRSQAALSKVNLVIIAPSFDAKFYKEAADAGILFIKAPGFGESPEKRMDHLIDISKITNTTVLSEWGSISKVFKGPGDLGSCETITCKKDMSTIVLPEELTEEHAKVIEDHVADLKKLVDSNDELTPALVEHINNRIADVSGGVCTIFIGALTPTEKEEKYDLLLDSLNSVNNSIKYGILPGGGTALLKASHYLSENIPKDLTSEERAGWNLVAKTLTTPAEVLIKTAMPEDYQFIAQKVRNSEDFVEGYDLLNDEFTNMVDAGIIDAAKIEMDVIKYSASTVSSFILSDGSITSGNANCNLDVVDRYMAEGK